MVNFGCLFSICRDIMWKRSRYRMLATSTMLDFASISPPLYWSDRGRVGW